MSKTSRMVIAGLFAVLGFVANVHAATEGGARDKVLKGDQVCTRCHDGTESYPVFDIGKTKHGTVADGRTGSCTACHGASETHIRIPEDATERPQPTVSFGAKSKTPVAERNAQCLNCHSGAKRMLWQGSTHEQEDLACTSCHQVHAQHDKVRDKQTQPEKCFTCHKDKRNEINKASRHPVKEGKVACSDCHNPHGSAGPKLMARDTVIDTCYSCHAEKRGPFLWNHQPVTEDCAICHNPHGSSNARLLKQSMPFLCQECHEPGSHQGIAPSSRTNASLALPQPDIASARQCVNCHTNLHGGNSPLNSSVNRSLVR